jgi:hypothetical protein
MASLTLVDASEVLGDTPSAQFEPEQEFSAFNKSQSGLAAHENIRALERPYLEQQLCCIRLGG